MHIWRVNLKTQNLSIEPVPHSWQMLGGRALSARILLDEIPPTCDPLSLQNKLIFAPGLLVGHMISSCDRISIGAKSPLTHTVKEANAGGTTGLHLTNLGIKALILEESAGGSGLWVLHLSKDGARFESAADLAGLGVYQSAEILVERYGKKVAIALIGPGGEMGLAAAGIQNLDKDRVPSRIAARGGLGAVMGSKGLKAVVIDDQGGDKPSLAHPSAFNRAKKAFTKALLQHPQTIVYRDYGTSAMSAMCNAYGALPTRNFSSGQFEQVDDISGETMRQLILQRGGEGQTTHACMPGCSIQCSNIFPGEDGKGLVSPLEYETIGLMGSNLGIGSLDDIARLNWLVNDLGLDSIEMGAALGVAAEAGLLQFGDGARALELLEEIHQGTDVGRILGQGAVATGLHYGVERVPAVKGQALSAYEPRAIKGTGVTYATSPQGADHTCGLTIRAKVDHLSPRGQVTVSRSAQINMAGFDSLGACIFAGFGAGAAPQLIPELLNSRYGWQVGVDVLRNLGMGTLALEREFNRRAGFTAKDDRLPVWMEKESLPPHNTVFDVPGEEMDQVFNW